MLKWVVAVVAWTAILLIAGAVAEAADVSRDNAVFVGTIGGILQAAVCNALWPD